MKSFIAPFLVYLLITYVNAAAWTFSAAKFEISGSPYTFGPTSPPLALTLKPDNKLKLLLTIKEDDTAKKPHQAMLIVKDTFSELEASLVIPVKSNGRGILSINYSDFGPALLENKSLDLTLVLGSFGDSKPLSKHVATIMVQGDDKEQVYVKPLRYGALPEITHTFRAPQKMPSAVISVAFSVILIAGLFGLFAGWMSVQVNFDAASTALMNAPIAYSIFLGSLFAIEGALFVYWTHLRIMAALGLLAALSVPAFFSGRNALRETEKRRKAGLR